MSDVPRIFRYVLESSTNGPVNIADIAMGIGFIYQGSQPVSIVTKYVAIAHFGTAYYSISLSLDFLLTLMIVGRIFRHSWEIRNAMGVLAKPSRLYTTIITTLVESCALYTVSYLLFLGPWASSSPVSNGFFPMLAQNQVRFVDVLFPQGISV